MKSKSIKSTLLAALAGLTLAFGAASFAEESATQEPQTGVEAATAITKAVVAEVEKAVNESKSVQIGESGAKIRFESNGSFWNSLEDVLVPLFFFAFLLAVILGRRYFISRNEQQRIELLRLMVEKGQPIPEGIVNQILSPATAQDEGTDGNNYKRLRNAYGFSIAGVGLVLYALINPAMNATAGVLVPALVFICLGAGGLAGIYLNKKNEKMTA